MTRTASRVPPILCPLRISPLALQSLRLRAIPRPRRWPRLRLWQLSNRRLHYLRRMSPSAHLLLMLNTPNRHPKLKHLIYIGRCPRRHRRLRNQISDRTLTSARGVHPILRPHLREGFSTNLCTNRLVRMEPVVFNGRSFVVSPVHLTFTFVLCKIACAHSIPPSPHAFRT
jgi:hypothetical protein